MDIRKKMWQSLPNAPGVYLMKASDGSPIYIGKAVNLRNRVRSYFQQNRSTDTPLTAQIIRYVITVDTIVTNNEIEALVLENNLIKLHQPRYNVKLKDDKRYPFLRVTTHEPFPRLMITRKTDTDGTQYYGPFVHVRSTRHMLKQLTKLFPIRTCSLPLQETQNTYRACLDYHIGKCPAPCANLINVQEYKEIVHKVCQFLGGNTHAVVKELKQHMADTAKSLDFEAAAKYRDMLHDLQQALPTQQSLDNIATERVDEDVIGIATAFQHDRQSQLGSVACVQVLHVRDGKLLEREDYTLNDVHPEQMPNAVSAFVSQYYQNAVLVPKTIVLPMQIESAELIEKWLSEKRGNNVSLHVAKAGRRKKLQNLATKNAEVLLAQHEHHVVLSRNVDPALAELQELLKIKHPLRRIEAYDISNLGDSYAVGSMVVLADGKPANSEYRQFRIKNVAGQNDYAMMQEVITRRFRRAAVGDAKFYPLPDLILIDGGKGQLNAVHTALQSFLETKIDPIPTQIPLIALAKRTEAIYIPDTPYPIVLREDNPTRHLIQRLRDEAHRFAITYHRKLRQKALRESVLDEIPNIGPKRKHALLQHFGSLDAIQQATLDELLAVHGIPRNVAENIQKVFREKK